MIAKDFRSVYQSTLRKSIQVIETISNQPFQLQSSFCN